MLNGRRTLYNNQPIHLLKKAAAESIKDGEVRIKTLMNCRSVGSEHVNSYIDLKFSFFFLGCMVRV